MALEVKTLVCPQCGASIDTDGTEVVKFCTYCGAVLPFEIKSTYSEINRLQSELSSVADELTQSAVSDIQKRRETLSRVRQMVGVGNKSAAVVAAQDYYASTGTAEARKLLSDIQIWQTSSNIASGVYLGCGLTVAIALSAWGFGGVIVGLLCGLASLSTDLVQEVVDESGLDFDLFSPLVSTFSWGILFGLCGILPLIVGIVMVIRLMKGYKKARQQNDRYKVHYASIVQQVTDMCRREGI